jgi:Virulence-associated protein E-like domain/Bifunctional DNA primase/polymerase, N-terminal/Primase C terminal 2 (PriCT-2)
MTNGKTTARPVLAAALGYADRGWDVFPAPPGQKKSYKSAEYSNGAKWGKTRDPEQIRRDFDRWPKANVGIPTGADAGFWVVELDTPKGHAVDGIAAMRALEAQHGPLPPTLMAESPSGSLHHYFKWPDVVIKNSTSGIAPGIDVRAQGGMVIAPPSVRGDGSYRWLNDNPIADAPPWLIDAAVAASKSNGKGADGAAEEPQASIKRIRAAFAIIPNENRGWDDWNTHGLALYHATAGSDDGLAIFHAWSSKSKKYNAQSTIDRWAHYKICPPTEIGVGSIFHWANEASPGWAMLIGTTPEQATKIAALIPLSTFEYEMKRKAVAEELGMRTRVLDDIVERLRLCPRHDGDDAAKQGTKASYMEKSTDWACNVGNVLLALEQEPEIMHVFGYDEMLRCVVLLRPLFHDDPNFKPRPVTDADVIAVQKHLQWLGFRRLGKDATHDGVNKHALDHAFHPVRDYLDGLQWDGKPRLGTWLASGFGAEQNEYTEQIGTMFPIAMVARIYQPGCKVDYMPTFEGEQGLMKSTGLRSLAGDEYFTDQLPDVITKECFQHLRGKWLIEVAELNAYSRAAVDHFKAFLVRQVERYRPPWGHNEVHEPRQCVFAGSTNKSLYLKDETGNRRFWPVKTGEINLDWLRAERDQLFAEAVVLYRAGVPWWPDRDFERQHIQPEQEARFEADAWEGPIKNYLDCLHEPKRTTILNIALNALGYELEPPLTPTSKDEPLPVRGTPINRLSPHDQRRITGILVHLGWVPKRDMKERWWEPEKAKSLKNQEERMTP